MISTNDEATGPNAVSSPRASLVTNVRCSKVRRARVRQRKGLLGVTGSCAWLTRAQVVA
jgi:hypothetical protein